MGLIGRILSMIFGDGRNAIAETVEVFRENAEAGAARSNSLQAQIVAQFAQEFAGQRRGGFDRVMDAVNRLPRPALALGTLALFLAAMVDPLWFAERMQGIALVPEPLWWLLGVVVSFYFGARHQTKSQEFHRDLATVMARAPQVLANLEQLRDLRPDTPGVADPKGDAGLALEVVHPDPNPALDAWQRQREG